jgi:preprotein translocase subunit SecY
MNKFISTIRNIFAIEDLRNRIFLTLGLLFIYRFGSYVVLPELIQTHYLKCPQKVH